MHRYVAVRLREEVIRALDELAKRNGVTRSLIIKRGIELVLKQQKIEIFIKDRPVKESKVLAKQGKDRKSEPGVVIISPRVA